MLYSSRKINIIIRKLQILNKGLLALNVKSDGQDTLLLSSPYISCIREGEK